LCWAFLIVALFVRPFVRPFDLLLAERNAVKGVGTKEKEEKVAEKLR